MNAKLHGRLFQLLKEGRMNRKVIMSLAIGFMVIVGLVPGIAVAGSSLAGNDLQASTGPTLTLEEMDERYVNADGDEMEGSGMNPLLRVTHTGSGGRGIWGACNEPGGIGVVGYAQDIGSAGNWGGYFKSCSQNGEGIYARATGIFGKGVVGQATAEGYADNYGGYFTADGWGGIGVYAKGGHLGYAADFQGNVIVRGWSSGETVVEIGEGLDYAEGFDVSCQDDIGPGSVLVIDPDNPGKLMASSSPYDNKVAGIVAGANGMGSGVRLGSDEFDYNVALAGRVYCNVDATEAGVEPGDLLTTSSTLGYAMKVTDYSQAQGAILGKAMEPLEEGKMGQILVLVTLQ